MRTAGAWATGLAVSALLHGVAAVILVPAYAPQDTQSQAPPETRLDMETVEAPRQDAAARTPEAEDAAEGEAEGTQVGAGSVPQSDARPVPATADRPPAVAAQGARATAQTPRAAPLTEADPMSARVDAAVPDADALTSAVPEAAQLAKTAAPQAQRVAQSDAPATTLAAARPTGVVTAPAAPIADALDAATPQGETLPSAAAEAAQLVQTEAPAAQVVSAALEPGAQSAPAVVVTAAALPAAPAQGRQTAALAPESTALSQERADAPTALDATPPATSARATLAWQFGDRVVTDPQALATIQAFMAPAAIDDAQGVKDDLSSLLTGVDCARLSATFIPETGVLEMRGHIPDPALQGPILAALQAQVGDGIPVTANLLHLPAPQCGALSGIASAGLPQSTDQFTNARLVGETAHAREYSYTEGQRLQFDLTAPDYDAFVYVDYFNADGEVIHLVPNETIGLERHGAETVFGVGKDRPGAPGLRLTIGPPFGQEIAVAFAASHPLYEGLRPIVEPAAPYLEALQAMVTEARAEHDDFKGEWVYFFITTSPATQ